jgi:hypothetical protein
MEKCAAVIDLTGEKEDDDDGDDEKEVIQERCKVLPFYMLKSKASSCSRTPQLELSDIICGNISSIILMNFCVDIEFLVSECPILRDLSIPVCCLHGSKGMMICGAIIS